MKRRTNKEIIESANPRNREHSYVKFPRVRLIPTTKSSTIGEVSVNEGKISKLMKRRGYGRYTDVHTHLYNPSEKLRAIPSDTDLSDFVQSGIEKKGMVVAQRDEKTGELGGYTYLIKSTKSKKNPAEELKQIKLAERRIEEYGWDMKKTIKKGDSKKAYEKLEEIAKKQNWGLKFLPARGYYFDRDTGNFERREYGLEKVVGSILVGFVLIFLFIKISFTGFIVQNSIQKIQSVGLFVGLGLFFSLIIFILLNGRKHKKEI